MGRRMVVRLVWDVAAKQPGPGIPGSPRTLAEWGAARPCDSEAFRLIDQSIRNRSSTRAGSPEHVVRATEPKFHQFTPVTLLACPLPKQTSTRTCRLTDLPRLSSQWFETPPARERSECRVGETQTACSIVPHCRPLPRQSLPLSYREGATIIRIMSGSQKVTDLPTMAGVSSGKFLRSAMMNKTYSDLASSSSLLLSSGASQADRELPIVRCRRARF
ncbi:hypothetical protein RRG08_049517 [Elysia crispata]|uniref:Uncharacterized protein n=1 Tax=Elysia crispata TaxID=231223 RepID=A0AAE0ZFG3_9GAST|nr:hypothetical protein RRG08_049517 [Elysia crispata]